MDPEPQGGQSGSDRVGGEIDDAGGSGRHKCLVHLIGGGVEQGDEPCDAKPSARCLPGDEEKERELAGMKEKVEMGEGKGSHGERAMRQQKDGASVDDKGGHPESLFHGFCRESR